MASTYLTKTFSTTGDRQKFTLSMWFKRGLVPIGNQAGTEGMLFNAYQDSGNQDQIWLQSNGTINYVRNNANAVTPSQMLRDPSAWYHVVFAGDTTQGSNADRLKVYINGTQAPIGQQDTIAQNSNFGAINNAQQYTFGRRNGSNDRYFDGSISHVHMIDGTAYDASAFGEIDSTTGQWKIKTSPSVTYGTNGFFILKDGNSVTDQSGNSNNFTVGGGTLTKTEDNPSNVFATGNNLIGRHTNGTNLVPALSNGNLTALADGSTWQIFKSTLGASSGKYYAEFKWISDSNTRYAYVGIYDEDNYAEKATGYPYMGDMANGYGYYSESGDYWNNSSSTSFGSSFNSSGDGIQGVAMDLDNSKLYFSKNGVWQGSGDPSNGTGGISITANRTYTFGLQIYAVGSIKYSVNFGNGYFGTTAVSSAGTNASGNGIFEYDVPTGFTALTTKGLNL